MDINTIERLRLFSRLFLEGITPGLLPALLEFPQLAGHFPYTNVAPDAAVMDEWAADHFHQFGMNVTPNASMYLDSEAMLGGAASAWIQELYSRTDFSPSGTSEGPDHIGNELAFLAHLLEQAAHLHQDGGARLSSEWLSIAARFLDEHLLLWLPVFAFGLQQQKHPFYSDAGAMLLREVLSTAERLPGTRKPILPDLDFTPEDLLSDPDTHIRDISRYLLTPIHSGVLLTRDRIAQFGRSTKLPRGFGDRLQILNNLIHSAADYEMIGGVLDLLEQEIELWLQFYNELSTPAFMAGVADFWKQRATDSLKMVGRMKIEIS